MPTEISVTLPLSQALARTKRMLFEPFDLHKWFVVGFCAWLAILGESGFNPGFRKNLGSHQGNPASTARQWFEQIREYVQPNLSWIIPVAICVALLAIAVWVALLWLSSRGHFMFLHCVALDRPEVAAPWNRYAREGNSLFGFRLVVAIVAMILLAPVAAGIVWLVVAMVTQGAATTTGVLGVVGLAGLALLVWPAWWVVARLTRDFVVPVQFARGLGCIEAWRVMLGLLSSNIANFVIYFLFQLALGAAISIAVFAVVIVTCCIAGCLLALPYLGTVLFLPVLVFQRSYSLYYLAQFGPEWNVLTNL